MAIVKMKKLRVMAMADHREALLQGLLHLGCVEISEPGSMLADPAWSALLQRGTSRLVDTKSEINDVNTALTAIRKYGQMKDGLFIKRHPITEQEFLGAGTIEHAREVSGTVGGLLQTLTRLQNEENRLLARQAALTPWSSLDMPLEMEGTRNALFRLGVFPGATDIGGIQTELADTAAQLLEISADKQQKYCLLICHRADEEQAMEILRPHTFSAVAFQGAVGTAGENLKGLAAQLAENRKAQEEATAAIIETSGARDALRVYADRLDAEAARETSAERLLTDGTILFFEGWAPEESMAQVRTLLEKLDCAWEAADPVEDEYPDVPVKLKNNWLTRPLSMVTDMYSLPAYNGVDPNPIMAPFFIFFYGMMMADMGYGLLMILISLYALKKARPKGPTVRNMFPLMGLCGVSTFIWGALSGGFFGDFLPQLAMLINPETSFTAMPALFSPVDDALVVLVGSLVLGVIQVFTGMAVNMYRQIKRGEVMAALCGEGAWYLVFVLIGVGVVTGALVPTVIAILAVLVLTQGYGRKGFVGKLIGIGSSLYNNITGYFSDILSYSRLMALMLAGAVIAQVFNTLGSITGFVPTFILISMVGNALNFALNLLGCYVHDMRLQCLEFFGRFYSDGGKPFTPLCINTKYVDIVNK